MSPEVALSPKRFAAARIAPAVEPHAEITPQVSDESQPAPTPAAQPAPAPRRSKHRRRCTGCGASAARTAVYCSNCGDKLGLFSNGAVAVAGRFLLVAAICLILLAAVVMALRFSAASGD